MRAIGSGVLSRDWRAARRRRRITAGASLFVSCIFFITVPHRSDTISLAGIENERGLYHGALFCVAVPSLLFIKPELAQKSAIRMRGA